jgi:hypothetical protein
MIVSKSEPAYFRESKDFDIGEIEATGEPEGHSGRIDTIAEYLLQKMGL